MEYCCDRPDHVVSGRIVKELWNLVQNAIECSMLSELFCRSMEDMLRVDGDRAGEVRAPVILN